MSVIMRNDYGAIAVNKGVIEKLITEDLLCFQDVAILCTKKGRPIRGKSLHKIDPDYYDALEIYEKKGQVKVRVFIISIFGSSISRIADEIFAAVESDFRLLGLEEPSLITVEVKGVQVQDQIIKRNIEVVRRNV